MSDPSFELRLKSDHITLGIALRKPSRLACHPHFPSITFQALIANPIFTKFHFQIPQDSYPAEDYIRK
jgi:hypothetical protein